MRLIPPSEHYKSGARKGILVALKNFLPEAQQGIVRIVKWRGLRQCPLDVDTN
jgi:hypothetical protein